MPSPLSSVPSGRIVLTGEDAHLLGDAAVVACPLLGLFCSVSCPGEIILGAYDLASALRDAGIPVAGGFHSPVERECLRLLLRGTQPLVICPARGLAGMRLPVEWQEPLLAGRLGLLAPLPDGVHRASAETAARRNAFVAQVCSRLLVLHAAPGGRLERFCADVLSTGKRVYTLASEHNAPIIALGAVAITSKDAASLG